MRKLLKWGMIGFAALVLVSIGAALGGDSSSEKSAKGPSQGQQAAANAVKDDDGDGVLNPYDPEPNDATVKTSEDLEPESTPAPEREAPKAAGTYKTNCDYVLPDDFETEDYRMVAGGKLRNTGNVGIVVRVRATWELLGAAPLVGEKKLSLKRGQSKRVAINIPVTGDQIDAHQSADSECHVKVKILDTFGKPPWEDLG